MALIRWRRKVLLNFALNIQISGLYLLFRAKTRLANGTRYKKINIQSFSEAPDEVIYVSESYTPECMHKRNRFMVDNSSAVIVYILSMSSGTAYTTNYALDSGHCRIINVLTGDFED